MVGMVRHGYIVAAYSLRYESLQIHFKMLNNLYQFFALAFTIVV